jgi:hypothetical protein
MIFYKYIKFEDTKLVIKKLKLKKLQNKCNVKRNSSHEHHSILIFSLLMFDFLSTWVSTCTSIKSSGANWFCGHNPPSLLCVKISSLEP